MKNKKQLRDNKTLDHAIAHLNGYAVTMKAMTGYNAVAVMETIKELERMKWKKKK